MIGVGGDGTLNDILNGVAHTSVPVTMLPAGTANVLTRELGLGTDPMRVAGILGDLVPERVAAGLLHAAGDPPRYFMLMAGIGFDGHIVYNLNLPLKARFGQAAYWLSAFKEIVRRLDEFDVEVDGRTYRCTFALASRVRNYAGWMRIAQTTSLWDREFEVVLFQGTSPMRHYLRHFARVVTARVAGAKGISYMRAGRVSFSAPSGGSIYVQVDGEFAGRLPARVEIVPDAVTVLVPPAAVESEKALNRRDAEGAEGAQRGADHTSQRRLCVPGDGGARWLDRFAERFHVLTPGRSWTFSTFPASSLRDLGVLCVSAVNRITLKSQER